MQQKGKRPRVTVPCVADRYASPGERIVEFSGPSGLGGLISLREHDGLLIVEVYRADKGVCVRIGGRDVAAHAASDGPYDHPRGKAATR